MDSEYLEMGNEIMARMLYHTSNGTNVPYYYKFYISPIIMDSEYLEEILCCTTTVTVPHYVYKFYISYDSARPCLRV